MLKKYISLSFILLILGIIGVVSNRRNLIILLMSIELMLLSINFLLLSLSVIIDNLNPQVFSLYILVVAAAESAIGLSILIGYYRQRGTADIKYTNLLKG
jgi:NADH-quinone oxidoreductase subunit K